jgi:hypothetical protein
MFVSSLHSRLWIAKPPDLQRFLSQFGRRGRTVMQCGYDLAAENFALVNAHGATGNQPGQ